MFHHDLGPAGRLLCISVLVVWAVFQCGLAAAQDSDALGPIERFQFWTGCQAMGLAVTINDAESGEKSSILSALEESLAGAVKDTKVKQDLRATAESRLRAARLYDGSLSDQLASGPPDEGVDAPAQYLAVDITRTPLGLRYNIDVEFRKRLHDPASGERYFATTWESDTGGSLGSEGVIAQSLSKILDDFLVKYLRVNEKECQQR